MLSDRIEPRNVVEHTPSWHVSVRLVESILHRFSPIGETSSSTKLLNIPCSATYRWGCDRLVLGHLKRAIERYLVCPLSRLLATAQVCSGDVLLIDRHAGENGLAFLRDTRESSYAQMPFAA